MDTQEQTLAHLESATKGFDALFSNELGAARDVFKTEDSPFHLLGLGVCAFLEAALGMETGLMAEATRCLTLSEANAKKHRASAKVPKKPSRFAPGLEWEICHADAVVLLGLTHALSESYMGYMQCLYSLNNAHSKFTKLYKTVFPSGLASFSTPAATPVSTPTPSRTPSSSNLRNGIPSALSTASSTRAGLLGRWGGYNTAKAPVELGPDGPVEDLIIAGTAFGFGLFNLVFSLLPAKIRGVVGWLGFQHDRKLALQALAVSAARKDVHGVFAGLVLMTYYGVVLLLSGYQADEKHILKQYQAIVDSVEPRYPTGALWILNRAKILRMNRDAEGAILVLQDGLKPGRPQSFVQADMLLMFELAWTLLSQRRYAESGELFIKITEFNSWSHATYYFIAAGCYIAIGNRDKAQQLLDHMPTLFEKRKFNGKELPTEVLIKKKLAFYKEKQVRRGGKEEKYADAIRIIPAEEIAIFWNNHTRITTQVAHEHINTLGSLSPPVAIASPLINSSFENSTTPADQLSSYPASVETTSSSLPDLDTADELAIRSLILGITHRTAAEFGSSRAFLEDARGRQSSIKVSTWVPGVSLFELAVLDMKEAEATLMPHGPDAEPSSSANDSYKKSWAAALKTASGHLDEAMAMASSTTDLSSRLDSRINMLRDEIGTKREMLGIAAGA